MSSSNDAATAIMPPNRRRRTRVSAPQPAIARPRPAPIRAYRVLSVTDYTKDAPTIRPMPVTSRKMTSGVATGRCPARRAERSRTATASSAAPSGMVNHCGWPVSPAADDLVHCGGGGRVVELAGAEEAEERVDEAGRDAVGRHARTGLVVGERLVAQRAPECGGESGHLFAGCQRLGAAQRQRRAFVAWLGERHRGDGCDVDRISDEERRRIAELLAEGAPVWRLHREINRSRYAIRRAVIALQRPASQEPKRAPLRLSLAEREEISRGLAAGESLRGIASGLGRAPSAVCREVAANGGAGRYRACAADRRALRLAHRPKPAKLARCPRLRKVAREQAGAALVAGADRGLAEGEGVSSVADSGSAMR
jgi:hypothetical protein